MVNGTQKSGTALSDSGEQSSEHHVVEERAR